MEDFPINPESVNLPASVLTESYPDLVGVCLQVIQSVLRIPFPQPPVTEIV